MIAHRAVRLVLHALGRFLVAGHGRRVGGCDRAVAARTRATSRSTPRRTRSARCLGLGHVLGPRLVVAVTVKAPATRRSRNPQGQMPVHSRLLSKRSNRHGNRREANATTRLTNDPTGLPNRHAPQTPPPSAVRTSPPPQRRQVHASSSPRQAASSTWRPSADHGTMTRAVASGASSGFGRSRTLARLDGRRLLYVAQKRTASLSRRAGAIDLRADRIDDGHVHPRALTPAVCRSVGVGRSAASGTRSSTSCSASPSPSPRRPSKRLR